MCGRRIEGWGGLLPSSMPLREPLDETVPRELPSQHDRTRPVTPSPSLILQSQTALDEESQRPTREMPSIGHELRAMAPDHRVHTSPTGHVLPHELAGLLQQTGQGPGASSRHSPSPASPSSHRHATGPTQLIPRPGGLTLRIDDSADSPQRSAGPFADRDNRDNVPEDIPEEHTDHIRLQRTSLLGEVVRMSLLAILCAGVAVLVGFTAYRLMVPATRGVAIEPVPAGPPSDEVPPVARGGGSTPAGARARPAAADNRPALSVNRPAGSPLIHRTRDLVVNVLPQIRHYPEHRGRGQGKNFTAPVSPTSPVPLDVGPDPEDAPAASSGTAQTGAGPAQESGEAPADPAPAPKSASTSAAPMSAPMTAPMSAEDQRREAEAQLAAADIEFVASNNNAQVRACHDRAFKDQPGGSPGGKLELSFTLNEEGRAVNVATTFNTTGSVPLARCLEQRVSEWRFPRPVGGAKIYQFPFVFLALSTPSRGP